MGDADQAHHDARQQRHQEGQVEVGDEPRHPAAAPGAEGAGAEALDGVDQLLVDAGDEGDGAARDAGDGVGGAHAGTPDHQAEISLQQRAPFNG